MHNIGYSKKLLHGIQPA